MSFNWYKVAQICDLQKQCIENDLIIFSGIENVKSKFKFSKNKDVDQTHHLQYIGDRIREGKKRESDIIEKINNSTCFTLKSSEDRQDIDGIDAFIVSCRNSKNNFGKLAVQIKHRLKGGDDLGLEVIKGWPPDSADIRKISFNGKDMKTPVDYYFHIDRSGKLRVFNGKIIRDVAQKISTEAITAWGHYIFEGNKYEVKPYGEIVIVSEKGYGGKKTKNNLKVITYIDIKKLEPTFTFNL